MTEPVPHLTGAQIERLLADLNQQSGSLTPDGVQPDDLQSGDLESLEEFVRRAGGIEVARELLDTLAGLDLEEDGLEAVDEEEDFWEDIDETQADDEDRAAA